MGAEDAELVRTMEVEDEAEGDRIDTTDYYFHRIGDAVPIKPSDSLFDLQNFPPLQPLAVSEQFGLIFVAHGLGFCVARTTDVMVSAKEIKEKGAGASVVEKCVVDVSIGRVGILALSSGSSTLAATVGGGIYFFSVESLLRKVQTPFFSCSLESNSAKSICWSRKIDDSFIVLSECGRLYKGALREPLQEGMDGVDAVDRGVRGDNIVVARKHTISILSSNLKEKLHISLPFKLWSADTDSSCTIRVDSIRWLRPDCIVVGCLQQTANENEENYLVQLITSQGGNFMDASSVTVVLQFSDLFPGIVDDIMPFGCGPHLLVCYFREWALGVFANRKNTSEHISLIGWSNEDKGPVFFDIQRDGWLPRIELQENDDDNLVLGLCVEKASVHEKVEVNLVEGKKELSPLCILLCLTLEGKLIMYHVSSDDASLHPSAVSALSDDEEDRFVTDPLHKGQQLAIDEESEVKKVPQIEGIELPKVRDLHLSEISSARQICGDETVEGNREDKLLSVFKSSDSNGKQFVITKETSYGQQSRFLEKEEVKLLNLKGGQEVAPSPMTAKLSEMEKLKIVDANSSTDQLGEKHLSDTSNLQNARDGKGLFQVGKRTPEKPGLTSLGGTSTRSTSTSAQTIPGGYGVRPPFESPSTVSSTLAAIGNSMDTVNISQNLLRKNGSHSPSVLNSAGMTALNAGVGQKNSVQAGRTWPSPSTHMPQGTFALTKSFHDFPSAVLPSRLSELKLSKHNDVNDMAHDMDKLLKGIMEEVERFKETCFSDQDNLLVSLEEGLKSLYDRSNMWKGYVNQQLEEVLHLFDKTVQAVARKVYMEGIIKQTTNGRYWDLWQSQELSSELQVRRKNIMSMTESLIDQLSELEKHFNALELNRFRRSEGDPVSHRSISASSGNIQSVRAVQNAITSQLAAAEQLSECLSRQMATLSMKSPEVKQEDFRKQLFKTIGIPYDGDDLDSPGKAEKAVNPVDRSSFSPFSIRDKSWGNEVGISSQEPETSRRRRDSLSQNLAKIDPPKTTIKRMSLHNECQDIGSSSMSLDKQVVSPFKLEVASPKVGTVHSTVLDGKKVPYAHKRVVPETVCKQQSSLFKWNKDISETTQGVKVGPHSMPTKNVNNAAVFTEEPVDLVVSKYPIIEKETHTRHMPEPDPQMARVKGHEDVQSKGTRGNNSDILSSQVVPVSAKMPPQKFLSPRSSGGMLLPDREGTILMQPDGENMKQRGSSHLSSSNAASDLKSSIISSYANQPAPSLKSSVHTIEAISQVVSSHTGANPVSSMSSSLVADASSASISSLSVLTTRFSSQPSIGDASTAGKESLKYAEQSVPKTASSLVAPTNFMASDAPVVDPLHASSTLISKPEERKVDEQPPADKIGGGTHKEMVDLVLDLQTKSSNAVLELGYGSKLSPSPVASNVASNPEAEKPSSAFLLSKEKFPSPANVSTTSRSTVDIAADVEDDMDEEASETSQTVDLDLGGLSELGMASTPSLSDNRSNPFGGSFATPVSTPNSFALSTPSNELFRPASFSFQSLQPSSLAQQPSLGLGSGGFVAGNATHASTGSGFGQPSQIGPGQQALGSVLGSFGQSRQLGATLPSSGFGAGFPVTQSASGFANGAAGGGSPAALGGFAALASGGGGFAGASAGGGFANAAGGSGFANAAGASGGFAGQASGGGGFGAFSNQGAGGFGTFGVGGGGGAGGGSPISANSLFTQMRK